MAFNTYDASSKEARILRAEAGDYIKRLRIEKQLTQKQVSNELGLDYYTFISQLECGQGSLYAHQAITTGKVQLYERN